MHKYVLDTSAVLANLFEEPGADIITEILNQAKEKKVEIYMPFMTIMETTYILIRKLGKNNAEKVLSIINKWPFKEEHSNRIWCNKAAEIKALPGRRSVADSWIASLALLLDAKLIHKDPELDKIPNLKVKRLPSVK